MDLIIREEQEAFGGSDPHTLPDIPPLNPMTGKGWLFEHLCAYIRYARPWWPYSLANREALEWWKENRGRIYSAQVCQKYLGEVPGLLVLRQNKGIGVAVEVLFQQQDRWGLPRTPLTDWPVGGTYLIPRPDDRLVKVQPQVREIAKKVIKEKGYATGPIVLEEWLRSGRERVTDLRVFVVQALRLEGYVEARRKFNGRNVRAYFPPDSAVLTGRPRGSGGKKAGSKGSPSLSANSWYLLERVRRENVLHSLDAAVQMLAVQAQPSSALEVQGKAALQKKAAQEETPGVRVEATTASTWEALSSGPYVVGVLVGNTIFTKAS